MNARLPSLLSRLPSAGPGWVWAAVAALLGLYATMALTASTHKGLSFDEGEQIATGYNIWLRGDFRMESANGDFVKRWATLPLLLSRPNMVGTADPAWREGDAYWTGYQFFFHNGNRPESLLLQTRAMVTLLGVATGLLVFLCSRSLFGAGGGLLSLLLFAFSPNMLAFGALVSSEMSLCLALLGSTWCVWLLHRVTWGRVTASLAIFTLLVLAKPTSVLILPITALMLVAKLVAGRPLEIELGRSRVVTARWAQGRVFFVLIVTHALVGWGTIWAHYQFRYDASPSPADPTIKTMVRPHHYHDPINPVLQRGIAWARRGHWFPQGYLYGIEWLAGHDDERDAFMDGQWTIGGWRSFFVHAAAVKTPPAGLLLTLAGLGWWLWLACRAGRPEPAPKKNLDATGWRPPSLYEAIPYGAMFAIYAPAAIAENLNIGHRHILPLYPVMHVLTGSVAMLWSQRGIWLRAALVALCLWRIGDSLSIRPDYLAYFSPLAGGPAQGYRHLVDSSLDWGMDLPALKQWLDKHNPGGHEPVYLSYFGTDSPDYYGIKAHRLPGFFDWRPREYFELTPGLYAISATLLQTVYTPTFGPWNKVYERDYQDIRRNLEVFAATEGRPAERAALLKTYPQAAWEREYAAFEQLRIGRLRAWLRHHGDPPASVGYTILIWRLDAAALRAALDGPPVELADQPIRSP